MSRQAHGAALPARRPYYHRCSCGRLIPEGVRRCSARTCPEYAPTWARDTRRRLLENLRIVPLTVMFSVTAPGADLCPFDRQFCLHRPVHRCSGRDGCRVNPELAAAFNRNAGQWWSHLHRGEGAGGSADRPQGEGRPATTGNFSRACGRSRVEGLLISMAFSAWALQRTVRGLSDMLLRSGSSRPATGSASSTAGTRSGENSGPALRPPRIFPATSLAGKVGRLRSRQRAQWRPAAPSCVHRP
jgi:hypothetical protein